MTRNPHHWRGMPGFEHIVIRHMADSATQLLAVKRGDIDAAFNLIPEQVATLKGDPHVRVEKLTSLDFVYMAVTQEPEFNKALAVKEARQAIGYAIDYDGIVNSLLGGDAVRAASFLPIGVRGSTEEIAKQIGFHQDLDRAKQLLQKAGLAERLRVPAELWRRRGLRRVLCGARAEDPVRSRARRHQGDAQPDGSGQSAHAIHRRQIDRGADLLEPTRAGRVAVDAGNRGARGQARPLDAARRSREARPCRGGGDRIRRSTSR